MKKYLAFMHLRYKRFLDKRFDMIIKNLQAVFNLFILYFFWKTIFIGKVSVNGYSFNEIVTYYFLVRVIYGRVNTTRGSLLASEIKKGEITNLLVKPIDYIGYWISYFGFGEIFWITMNAFTILLFSFYLYSSLLFPKDLMSLILFFFVLLLNGLLSEFINLLVGFAGFWVTEIAHLKLVTSQIISLLAGALIPLTFFPEWARKILDVLPFRFLIQFPVEIYLGKISNYEIFSGILILCFWCFLLYLITKKVLRSGLKIYESYN